MAAGGKAAAEWDVTPASGQSRQRHRQSRLDRAWPWVLKFVGVGMLVYETVFDQFDRPSVFMAALALLGVDRFVHFDRQRNGSNGSRE